MKRTVKKTAVFFIVCAMILAFAACSGNGKKTGTSSGSSESGTQAGGESGDQMVAGATAEQEAPKVEEGNALNNSMASVTVKVLLPKETAPYVYADRQGALAGFDVALIQGLQEMLGFQVEGEIAAANPADILKALEEGTADITLMEATAAGREVADFSATVYAPGQIVCINKQISPEAITGADALKSGKYPVAVAQNSAALAYADANIPVDRIRVYNDSKAAFDALANAEVDAMILDEKSVAYYLEATKNQDIETVGSAFVPEGNPLSLGISDKMDATQRERLKNAIKELEKNGTLAALQGEWLK